MSSIFLPASDIFISFEDLIKSVNSDLPYSTTVRSFFLTYLTLTNDSGLSSAHIPIFS